MSAFFLAYRIWFQIGAIITVVAAFTWGVHTYNEHFREIGRAEVKAEWVVAEQAAKIAADKQEALWKKQVENANEKASEREKTITVSANAAAATSRNLRDTLEAYRGSVSGATASSLANAVNTLANLLGDCSERYRGLAEKADRHASDFQRCVEQWPKNEVRGK